MAIPPPQNQIDLLDQESADGSNPLDLPESTAPILDAEEKVNVAGLKSIVEFGIGAAKRIKQGTKSKEALAEIAKQNEAEIARLKDVAEKAEKARAAEAKATQIQQAEVPTPGAVTGGKVTTDAQDLLPKQETGVQVVSPEVSPAGVAKTDVVVQQPQPPELVRKTLDEEKVKAVMIGELPEDELIEIDWANVSKPEDLDILTARVEKVFADEISGAKRGVLSDDEVVRLARELNIDQELLNRRVGTMYSAEQIRAAGMVVNKAKQEWNRLNQELLAAADQGVDDVRLAAAFKAHTELTSAYIINFKGAKAEAGRALRAARELPRSADGEVDIVALNAQLKDFGGVDSIKNMARMVRQLDSDEQSVFLNRLGTANKAFKEAWTTAWYSGVLSSTTTFMRALFGSIDMMLMRPIDAAFGSTVGRLADYSLTAKQKALSLEKVSAERGLRVAAGQDPMGLKIKPVEFDDDFVDISEAAIMLSNGLQNVWNGLKAGGRAFKTGEQVYGFGQNVERTVSDSMSASKFANPESWVAQSMGFINKVMSVPQRGMMFVDEFAGAITYESELRTLAARRAAVNIRNGMDADEAMLLMSDEIVNPSTENIVAAQNAAKEVSLRADLGPIGSWMMKVRSQLDDLNAVPLPVGTIQFAFLKTIINLEKNLYRRTPLAPILGDVRDDLAAGGARRQMALGRFSAGMGLAAATYNLAVNGTITGLGPTNSNLRQQMQNLDNWQPCSVKGGDGKYHSIMGLGPMASLTCISATFAENMALSGKPGAEENENLLMLSGAMYARRLQEIPMLGQTADLLKLIEKISSATDSTVISDEIARYAAGYTAPLIGGGIVPFPQPYSGLLRQIEQSLDPATRSVSPDPSLSSEDRFVDFFWRNYSSRFPGLSEDINPRRNVLGQEYAPITTGGWEDIATVSLTPFLTSYRTADPMVKQYIEYSRLRGKPIFGDITKTINNIKLNDNELSDLKLFMNEQRLDVVINGSRYSGITLRDGLAFALQSHKQEADEGRFNGLATTASNLLSQFKQAGWNSPKFRAKYPETYRQIRQNEIMVENKVDPLKRRPLSSDKDEDVFDLRDLLEPTK